MGSSNIPSRYIQLDKTASVDFKESGLQEQQPSNLNNGRSERQLNVYYNILNIMGDRMRNNPNTSIVLTGAADKDPAEGRLMAENIKQYLVNNYDIASSRITTEGRDKPVIPSEQPEEPKN
jgi:outer membrane protein OmpA-like peptidoglycan-associated protein